MSDPATPATSDPRGPAPQTPPVPSQPSAAAPAPVPAAPVVQPAASAAPTPAPAQPASAQPQGAYAQATYGQPQASYAQAAYAQPQPQPQPVYAGPGYAPPASPKKGGKAIWVVLGVILFAIVFVFTIGALSCSATVSGITSQTDSLLGSSAGIIETTGDSVGVIDITGTIQYDGTSSSPEGLRALLVEAEENPDIKAVVLRVDSGGGVATAGEEMAAYVRDFNKPVVVSSASVNCSAAYEISSQADYIFVNETTAIGAIGTAMQVSDISGLLDMLGVDIDNITSAESKDSSYGTRPLTEEERAYYQDLVDTINESFIETVAEGRGMSIDEVRALATGMQFTGTTAVGNGLADEVGIYDAALDKAAELGGLSAEFGYDVVQLTDSSADLNALMDLLGASQEYSSNDAVQQLLGLLKEEGVLS